MILEAATLAWALSSATMPETLPGAHKAPAVRFNAGDMVTTMNINNSMPNRLKNQNRPKVGDGKGQRQHKGKKPPKDHSGGPIIY